MRIEPPCSCRCLEEVVKLEGLGICDFFYPVALLFQVIVLVLHVINIIYVGNIYVGDNAVTAQSSLEGGGVVAVITNIIGSNQALNAVSSVWSATSSLWGGVPSCGLQPLRVVLCGVEAQFSTGGWNSMFVIGLFLLGCIRAVLYLIEFIHPNRGSQQRKRKRKRGKRNWRNREKKFRRRKLHVNLVKRCRRRVGNRPPRRDGSRFRSPRDTKHARWKRREARQRNHWEEVSLAKELWEFCGSPRPKPTHVDAPVWEPLLDWFCFESDFADDFPAYGRMSAALDADERDKWKESLDAEERTKLEEYLDKFIATEDHVENVKKLQARARKARDSMDGNRGSKNRRHSTGSRPGTSLWSRVLNCWRSSRQRSVLGRLAFATGSTYLGFLEGRSFNYFGASTRPGRTYRVSFSDDARYRAVAMVFDTGASNGLTPFKKDFVDYVEMELNVKDVSSTQTVIGIGTTLYKFIDTKGQPVFVPCISYHLPTTDVRLFSPQAHHQIWKPSESHLTDDGSRVVFIDRGVRIEIPIDRAAGNIPLVYNCSTTKKEQRRYGPEVLEALPRCPGHHFFADDEDPEGAYAFVDTSARRTSSMGKFGRRRAKPRMSKFGGNASRAPGKPRHPKFGRPKPNLDISKATFALPDPDPDPNESDIAAEFSAMLEHRGFNAQVIAEENSNLSAAQKELLLWEMRLGIGMRRIQRLMRPRMLKEPDGTVHELPPVIKTKHKAQSCEIPVSSCTQMSAGKRKSTGARISKPRPPPPPDENAEILQRPNLSIGDVVSCDQYVCSQSGRLELGFGREGDKHSYTGGTLYVESVSGFIWNHNQVSLGAAESIMGKEEFETWVFNNTGRRISHYHSDNGIFASKEWRANCATKFQTQSFSGVNAQHMNGKAERSIGLIMNMARTFLINVSLSWTGNGVNSTRLWPMAVNHAVWIYNRLPDPETGISPLERITGMVSDHRDLQRTHVWGCPVFVLADKLANGQKLPKFDRRKRRGQFVGFSRQHSSKVALVRNLTTGHISPVWDVVFDDKFSSVFHSKFDNDYDTVLDDLLPSGYESYESELDEVDAEFFTSPPLHKCWLTEHELQRRQQLIEESNARRKERATIEVDPFEFGSERIVDNTPIDITPPSNANFIPNDTDSDCSSEDDPSSGSSSGSEGGGAGQSTNLESHGNGSPDAVAEVSEGDESIAEVPEGDGGSAPEANRTIQRQLGSDPAWDGPRFQQPTASSRSRGSTTDSHGRRRSERHRNPNRRSLRRQRARGSTSEGASSDNHRISTLRQKLRDRLDFEGRMRLSPDQFVLSSTQTDKRSYAPSSVQRCRRAHAGWNHKQRACSLQRYGTSILTSGCDSFLGTNMVPPPKEDQNAKTPKLTDVLNSPLARYITFAANECGYGEPEIKDLLVNTVHPMFLKAKSAASKHDNPTWWQAMASEHADDFWEAAKTEIRTLEEMDSWRVVDRTPDMNVIGGTWAFKIKRFPDGLIKKFKARFCARGDQQLEGVDFFETYAPVVQWSTVRLMLILEILLKLKSKQGDITAAFLHADIPENENVYVEMPKGFEQKGKVLKLRKTLYGLRQSPRAFWQYLTEKLEANGMKQSELDPCLFIGEKVICIVYVDDLLFWARDEADINDLAYGLRDVGVDLEEEHDAAGFLGVSLTPDPVTNKLEMRQDGLIERCIEAVGLDNATTRDTPCQTNTPLVRDDDGEPAIGDFNYASVVGMLMYLAGHTRPDIAYAVNCCARYMFNPKRSHEEAVKRIVRYLKATRDRGMIFDPTEDLALNCYPDADFAGMYGHERSDDPTCVKSRTGYVITFAGCPVVWQSKLQTETALSTMEAEIVALAHSCRVLLPLIDIAKQLTKAVGKDLNDANMQVSIHEDNAGALILAKTLPPGFTPRSKHYAVKTIWFREQIVQRGIKLCKIDTKEQLGDLFTKGLPLATFVHLRGLLMGW